MMRAAVVLGTALLLAVSGALGLAGDDTPAPATGASVPGAPATADGGDLDATVAALRDRVDRAPADAAGWASLALAYVEQARVSGDPSRYDDADDAIDRSFAAEPDDNAAAWAAAAAVAAARHDFTGALEAADRALAIDPYLGAGHAVRIDALTELGRYDEQQAALRLADRRQPGFAITTRWVYALELRGRLGRAASVLEDAARTSVAADRAFALALLADVERRQGRLSAAARHLEGALGAVPGYLPALAGRADLATARGDLGRATRLWEDLVGTAPTTDHRTALAEVYLVTGRADDAREQLELVAADWDEAAEGSVDIDVEAAHFEADHGDPSLAVDLARAEWDRRRTVHTADTLGWALHRAGLAEEALRPARLATRLGTADAELWLHRGLVEAANDRDDAARRSLLRGLDLDPGVSPWLAEQARDALRGLGSSR